MVTFPGAQQSCHLQRPPEALLLTPGLSRSLNGMPKPLALQGVAEPHDCEAGRDL